MYNPQKESKEIELYMEQLNFKFKELESILQAELLKIKSTDNFEDLTDTFVLLNEIMYFFGKYLYNSNYKVSDFISNLFREFDRIDLLDEQKRLFKYIKETNGVLR